MHIPFWRSGLPVIMLITASFAAATPAAQAQTGEITMPASLRANTTAASDSFPGTFNGLPKPGSLSPLPVTSLLPSGDRTRYIAHLMPWFKEGCSKPDAKCAHAGISGYQSNDAAQVARQLEDMHRRGFSVVFIDWYGYEKAHAYEDQVTQLVMREAERLKSEGIDFAFAIQPDKGIALKCDKDKACDTQKMLEALTYAYTTYESSPAYFHWNGRPVVPFFLSDSGTPIDWDDIHARVLGNPVFVYQGPAMFNHPYSGGAYSWNKSKEPSDIGLTYLDEFYRAAATVDRTQQMIIGSAYPGFDDRLASWGKGKIIARRCGLTWLDTMNESLRYEQATGSPLPFLQVVTWNDYEEGTATEMGIDNCITGINGTVKNNHLLWSVAFGSDGQGNTGSEQTIAYFRIFSSLSGDRVRELARMPANSVHDLDLTPLHIPQGQTIYIQAVGKAQILNHLSGPIAVQ